MTPLIRKSVVLPNIVNNKTAQNGPWKEDIAGLMVEAHAANTKTVQNLRRLVDVAGHMVEAHTVDMKAAQHLRWKEDVALLMVEANVVLQTNVYHRLPISQVNIVNSTEEVDPVKY